VNTKTTVDGEWRRSKLFTQINEHENGFNFQEPAHSARYQKCDTTTLAIKRLLKKRGGTLCPLGTSLATHFERTVRLVRTFGMAVMVRCEGLVGVEKGERRGEAAGGRRLAANDM
jgi:hypothetical protein